MLRESSCYAPTRTVLKIVKAKQEMRFQVLILCCWMTWGQAFNLHFPMYTSDFKTLGKNSAVKIVYCLKRILFSKSTAFQDFQIICTLHSFTQQKHWKWEKNIWLVIHLTQPVQPISHPGGSEKAKEPYTQVFTSGVTLTTGEIWVGAYGFLTIWVLRDRIGIQWGSWKCFK